MEGLRENIPYSRPAHMNVISASISQWAMNSNMNTPYLSFFFFFLPERLSEFVYFAWQISVFLSALPSVLKWAEICLKCHILASLRVLIISIFLTLYIRVAFPYSSLICCFIGWILLANWLFISHNKAHIHAINHCMLELRIMESSPRWLYHTYCAIYMDVKSHL